MKEFLLKQGLSLEAFSAADKSVDNQEGRRDRLEVKAGQTKRQLSGTAFLIKNLPIGTTDLDVSELLVSRCAPTRPENVPGEKKKRVLGQDEQLRLLGLRRVIVPILGITAIVEFELPQQARHVFKKLAYEPYQDGILFLQWLPNGALRPFSEMVEEPVRKKRRGDSLGVTAGHNADSFDDIAQPPDASCHSTLRVTSALINDDQEEDEEKKEGSTNASVPRKKKSLNSTSKTKDISAEGKQSRRGYKNKKERLRQKDEVAHAVGQDEETADAVEEEVPAEEQSSVETSTPKEVFKPTKPVLLVRNLAFQANEKEVKQLFKPIGGLVKVRLPVKSTGGHRGFAFLEFAHMDQAESALQTLGANTHLYGRRLRLEYAKAM